MHPTKSSGHPAPGALPSLLHISTPPRHQPYSTNPASPPPGDSPTPASPSFSRCLRPRAPLTPPPPAAAAAPAPSRSAPESAFASRRRRSGTASGGAPCYISPSPPPHPPAQCTWLGPQRAAAAGTQLDLRCLCAPPRRHLAWLLPMFPPSPPSTRGAGASAALSHASLGRTPTLA